MTEQGQRPPIAFGEIAPFYIGITNKGVLYSTETQAGRAAAFVAVGSLEAAHTTPLIQAFDRRAADFKAADADVTVLTTASAVTALEYTIVHPTALVVSSDAAPFMAECGFAANAPFVVVVDKNRAAVGVFPATDDVDRVVADALEAARSLVREASRDIVSQAPVLFIPNAASPELRRDLMELFEKGGHFDSGFMTVDKKGAPVLKIDHAFKRRYDHFVHPGHPMYDRLLTMLARRIIPEIKKAFHIDVTHSERFLIARYDESGGYFRRHRDNVGEANAHRQFAMTLNLNTEDYEGGHLVFPEYSPHRYRPASGEAAIFSGSLLHEALPVTNGTRFALLGFLHDAQSEARHQAYREGRG